MRLVCSEYNIDLSFKENEINILSIENQQAFSKIVQDFWSQEKGDEGHCVLSEQDHILRFDQVCRCIFNPFSIDCNERKIINKVYAELNNNSLELFMPESTEVNKKNFEFIEKICATVPYALNSNLEMSIVDLLKMYDVKFAKDYEDVVEQMIEYMRISHMVLGINLFIYINLKQYLTSEQLFSLYEFASYEKIYILIVEGEKTSALKREKHCILDKDLCIIDLDTYE